MGVKIDNVLYENEVLAGVPEKEESYEDNVGMEMQTQADKHEYGVLNANEVVFS